MKVLLVDPETKRLVRMDSYRLDEKDDQGNPKYDKGMEVLEYNQPFDPMIFEPKFPAGTVIIDQVSGPVGMAQGDLSNEDVAYEVASQALEALAMDDYETAGLLFGGAPPEYFERRRNAILKPAADIVVGEPRPYEWFGPTFFVPCSYMAEKDGRPTKVNCTLWVGTEVGQPGQWFIKPHYLDFSVEE